MGGQPPIFSTYPSLPLMKLTLHLHLGIVYASGLYLSIGTATAATPVAGAQPNQRPVPKITAAL